MSDNDETAPVPRLAEPAASGSVPPPVDGGSAPAPLPPYGTAPQYGPVPLGGTAPQYGTPAQHGTPAQYGPVPSTGAGGPRPNRRALTMVAVAIGGVLLVGSGFGVGLVVGHATARSAGHGVLVSRFDQRGAMPGPGYAQGRGGKVRPFGGQGVIPRRAVPTPAIPSPAPTS